VRILLCPVLGIMDEKIGVSDELHVAQIFARNRLSVRSAERLMAIARNPVLTKSDNLSLLPPSWAEAARQRQHRHDSHRSNRDVRR
jgi:hypothetical protein